MAEAPRKLGEIWKVAEGYQLRVVVDVVDDSATAEDDAHNEVIEILRKIVANNDAALRHNGTLN